MTQQHFEALRAHWAARFAGALLEALEGVITRGQDLVELGTGIPLLNEAAKAQLKSVCHLVQLDRISGTDDGQAQPTAG